MYIGVHLRLRAGPGGPGAEGRGLWRQVPHDIAHARQDRRHGRGEVIYYIILVKCIML